MLFYDLNGCEVMGESLLQRALTIGREAVQHLSCDATCFSPFLDAARAIYRALRDDLYQLRLYSFDREKQILFEEAFAGNEDGQGEDQLFLSQLPEDVKNGLPLQRRVGHHTDVYIPLRIGRNLVGLMVAGYEGFSAPQDSLTLLDAIGHVIAPGVYATIERRKQAQVAGFLRSAVRMSRELAGISGGGSDRLLYHHVNLVVEELGFDRATLFMFESDGKLLERGICAIAGQAPFEMDSVDHIRVPLLGDEPIFLQEFPGVWVPINVRSKRLGALLADNLYSLQEPPADVIQVLVDVSGQVALAMENAQLLERLQDMALRDELTGLFRPGYFHERIQEELAKVEREQSSAGLLFIDLDDFKRINDAYGHQAGDAVLAQVADVIRSSIRASDVACRMGGDEFIILLPGITMESTHRLAARFCRRIHEHHFLLPEGGTVQLTASVGVASFPEDASGWHQLVHRADEAMYMEKRARKSRMRAQRETTV